MPLWAWIVIGGSALVAVSSAASLAVAAILGGITSDVSALIELESWATAPLEYSRRTAARA